MKEWNPASWRKYEARQQPDYADQAELAAALQELASYPPLVNISDVRALQTDIAEAQSGRAILLQGGDCAESFAEFSPENIKATSRLIEEMAAAIEEMTGTSVVKVGRLAGQFAKPRSRDVEEKGAAALPVYRGDIINGISFDPAARVADPQRMFRAYAQAYATIARLADLTDDRRIYTSHEALLLPWEEALTRFDAATGLHFATSAHFVWIGDRTRFLDSAHVEFARGIANPVGIKCGPSLQPDELLRLLDRLNADREPGRITLITRMGAGLIEEKLPALLRAVAGEGHPVLWSCDPMHGNTIKASNGYKTRPVSQVMKEVRSFASILLGQGVWPGGLHVEMTGQNVTECTGGLAELTDLDLEDRYHTHCDPRLNPEQGMELAELAGHLLSCRPDPKMLSCNPAA